MSDKRSVATDALETLGTIIESGGRDAIHLAVEPTVAAEKLYPGQDVGADGSRNNPVGIVDPFLKQPVLPGEKFWLVVYPRQINSLRHVWTHPAFKDEVSPVAPTSKAVSEAWLRDFCKTDDCPSYERVMALITSGHISEEYGNSYMDEESLHFSGSDAHGEIPPEFWNHVEIVLGKKMEKRPKYFSCSC